MAIVLYEGIMCCIFVDYDGGHNSCILACSKSGWMVGGLRSGGGGGMGVSWLGEVMTDGAIRVITSSNTNASV
jgi:hypothetical protein